MSVRQSHGPSVLENSEVWQISLCTIEELLASTSIASISASRKNVIVESLCNQNMAMARSR